MEKNEQVEINQKIVSMILYTSICSALFIMLIQNLNIDGYLKNFTIPLVALLINFGIIVEFVKPKINKKAFMLLIPIILILISNVFLEMDVSNRLLSILILPILISIFFFSLINEKYCISRLFFKWALKLFPSNFFNNFEYIKFLSKKSLDGTNEKSEKIKNIVSGIFIGVPIAIILLVLLTSADQYFNVFIESIGNFFADIFNIDFRADIVVQNVVILVGFFVISFSILINTIRNKDSEEKFSELYKVNQDISKIILIIVNAVFVLFLISELSRITVNFLNLPIEYTFASYAREGFFQLLFVTAINFSIILYFLYYVAKENVSKYVKILLVTLIGFSILLIFNSYYRMFLYIGNYGFTILRLQVILFLLMELILFSVMIKKIVTGLKLKDAIIFTSVIISTYVINIYLCHQQFIDLLNKIFNR